MSLISRLTRRIASLLASLVLVAGFGVATSSSAQPEKPLPPPAATAAEVENPYGLKAMVEHGDAVSKTVLALLAIMSMGTWYVLFTKLYEQQKLLKDGKRSNKQFWSAGSVAQGAPGGRRTACRTHVLGRSR